MTANINEIDTNLQKFWEMEEIAGENNLLPEEQQCIKFFENSIKRNPDGTYIAALPFKDNKLTLGDSRKMALAQMFQME